MKLAFKYANVNLPNKIVILLYTFLIFLLCSKKLLYIK